jgi:hypothetical protein
MTISLKYIMRCEILGLDESFQSTCFSHVFFKTCQYATIGKKIYNIYIYIYQLSLHNQICKHL